MFEPKVRDEILKATWPTPGSLDNELEVALKRYLASSLIFKTSTHLQI